MTDLSFATNEELIRELMGRSSFKGFALWQISNFKGKHDEGWRHEASNMTPLEVVGAITELAPKIVDAHKRDELESERE